MKKESRTSKSIHNIKIAFLFFFINLLLQFFSRKIFLDYLGSEVLGLNTTAQNLLGFLNLAELGIGGAVAYNLYKPLYEKNFSAIIDIVSIQGWLYRRIAYVIIGGSSILMCFFPLIFSKAEVPVWYTYGTFIVLLLSSLLSYFVNYKQIVLSADQKQYKITQNVQGCKIIKIIFQIIAIKTLPNGYVWWLIIETIMAIITSICLTQTIKHEYPWLHTKIQEGRKLNVLYPNIMKKTKQSFFHNIGTFILAQTSPLIIYAYSSLTLVAIYGNYLIIVKGIESLMSALLNGINAGIGNLIAEGNKKNIKHFFWEITLLRMWLASIICFGLYMLGDSFITLWIGAQYQLTHTAFILLVIITFIGLTRTNDSFIAAYGMFQDIWAPIAEATLNLGCSIILGYFYGLEGILCGVLISLLVIVCGWKAYYLYHYGFHESIHEYIKLYFKYIILLITPMIFSKLLLLHITFVSPNISYLTWTVYAFETIVIYTLISSIILYFTDNTAKRLTSRLKKIISKK